MTNIYTIATKSSVYEKLLEIPVLDYVPVYQARPKMQLPLLVRERAPGDPDPSYQFLMGYWGIAEKGKPQKLTSIPMSRVLKQRDYNLLIRRQRCAIPANCFVINDNVNAYVVKLLKQRFFWIGGVYEKWQNKRGFVFYNFCPLKVESPDVLSGLCEEIPLVIAPDRFRAWLEDSDPYNIMQIADRAGRMWYDYFKVSNEILEPFVNDRDLLKPLGSSYQQIKQRVRTFASVNVEELRANSRGRK